MNAKQDEVKTLARGTMNLIKSPRLWLIPYISVFVLWGIAMVVIYLTLFSDGSFPFVILLSIVIPGIIGGIIYVSAKSGKPAEYIADSEKFIIRQKNKPEECIYYSEVRSVTIEPLSMGTLLEYLHAGYTVTIETAYRNFVYYYALSGPYSKTAPEDTPFAIIGKNIPKPKNNEEKILGLEDYHAVIP